MEAFYQSYIILQDVTPFIERDEATQDIFEYIEVIYNRQRRHSTLGYHSPAEYEARTAVA